MYIYIYIHFLKVYVAADPPHLRMVSALNTTVGFNFSCPVTASGTHVLKVFESPGEAETLGFRV